MNGPSNLLGRRKVLGALGAAGAAAAVNGIAPAWAEDVPTLPLPVRASGRSRPNFRRKGR